MASEFLKKRHAKPDYDVDLRITGVRLGDTGSINWQITIYEDFDPLLVAQILEKAIVVLRGGGENRESPEEP